MKNWQKFEKNSFEYLNNNFSNDKSIFTLLGESDSSKSDIHVKTSYSEFFIEIKSPISQGGQFVLSKNTQKQWAFGEDNKSKCTPNANIIIDDLNSSKNTSFSTTPTILNSNTSVLYNWIIDFYKQKNVHYIITTYNDEYVIFPLSKISLYLDIEGVVRKKGSGSADVTNPFWNKIKDWNIFKNITSLESIGKKRYLYFNSLPKGLSCQNPKIIFADFVNDDYIRIQLELIDINSNKVYIRKLSTTSNPTVIFNFKSKQKQISDDLNEFKNKLI